jgi:hypothetical protein
MRTAIQGLLLVLLIGALVTPALALDSKGYVHHQDSSPRVAYQCDDGWLDNAYYENQGYGYGNGFSVGAGGPLSWIDFWHYGWSTWQGESQYQLHIFDEGTCTEVASIGPYAAADAYDMDQEEIEDLCGSGVSVTGDISVLVEPLSCASATDCYPDVYFDQTGTADGCDRVQDLAAPDCSPYWNGDFVLRIGVDECGSPVEPTSWGGLKASYR